MRGIRLHIRCIVVYELYDDEIASTAGREARGPREGPDPGASRITGTGTGTPREVSRSRTSVRVA